MIGALYRNEIRMLLRDRRTILASIILPMLLTPIMLFSSTWTTKKRQEKLDHTTYQYAITGSRTNELRALVVAAGKSLTEATNKNNKASFKFEEKVTPDPRDALTKGEIHFFLEEFLADESFRKDTNTQDHLEMPRTKLPYGLPMVRMVYRADRDDSASGMNRLQNALRDVRIQQREELLKRAGFPVPFKDLAVVSSTNIASDRHVAGLKLGRLVTVLLLFFLLTGGAVVATDLVSGEKERGTLETLLTSAASRIEIAAAKHFVILTVAFAITLIQSANLILYVSLKLIPMPANLGAALSPGTALLLLVLYAPMAALVASVLLLVSGYAKTYKESQLYFFPIFLVAAMLGLAPLLPAVPLRSAVALVPVANIAVAAKEILIGSFDWPMILISWGVTAAAAWWTTGQSVRVLSAEKLITATEKDAVEYAGGPELFSRHVLRWFGVLWAVLLIVNNYIATSDIRVQITVNLVGLFFGASLLMLWRYQLDPREVLALRAPKPMVWAAVLLIIPGGILTGTGLSRLATRVFPVPPEMVEAFGQAVIPASIPLPQLLFFLALMPGVFEEITFRGLLLYGLQRRWRPIPTALAVGIIFGIFHGALFRLVPTAWLGVLFAAITLLTGSIFPAMLAHALNNGLGILAAKHDLPVSDLDAVCYWIGALALAAGFGIVWRNRTPCPRDPL